MGATDRHAEEDRSEAGSPFGRPRAFDVADLLRREPVRVDDRPIEEFLRGRVVLVTGAAGSIGSEICRQALAFRPGSLVLLDHWENGLFWVERELLESAAGVAVVPRVGSVTDADRLRAVFDRFRPSVVLHAAAHKHVPMMESNPGEAVKTNVLGTRALADEAANAGVEAFVLLSTDKAANPRSVMGACKRVAEMYVQALAAEMVSTRFVTVRFGNVLGSSGSVVPLLLEQIRRGGPLTLTHPDMTRHFMAPAEAARLVLQAGALGGSGDVLVPDLGAPVRVLDLARDLIRLSGLVEGRDVGIVFTGVRPGEKLAEELFGEGEERLPTPHPGVHRARRPAPDVDRLRARLDRLAGLVDGPQGEIIAALERLVSEYRPDREAAAASPREGEV